METKKNVDEYDYDEMVNQKFWQMYNNMHEAIRKYASEKWYDYEGPLPFEYWWEKEDKSTLERDLRDLSNEFLADIVGYDGKYDTLDEGLHALAELCNDEGKEYLYQIKALLNNLISWCLV